MTRASRQIGSEPASPRSAQWPAHRCDEPGHFPEKQLDVTGTQFCLATGYAFYSLSGTEAFLVFVPLWEYATNISALLVIPRHKKWRLIGKHSRSWPAFGSPRTAATAIQDLLLISVLADPPNLGRVARRMFYAA